MSLNVKNIFIKLGKLPIFKQIYQIIYEIFLEEMPLDEFENYDEYWKKRGDTQILYRFKYVCNQLPESGILLDVGCGSGRFLKYLKSKKPNMKLMGLDTSQQAIDGIKREGIDGKVVDLQIDKIMLDLQPDYVVSMEVLEHLHNPEELMRDLRKLNAKKYYITIPNIGFIFYRFRLFFGGKMPVASIIFHIREHIRFWTFSDFKYWAKCMGFKLAGYHGQNGFLFFWRIWPSLFARQMIYVLEIDSEQS